MICYAAGDAAARPAGGVGAVAHRALFGGRAAARVSATASPRAAAALAARRCGRGGGATCTFLARRSCKRHGWRRGGAHDTSEAEARHHRSVRTTKFLDHTQCVNICVNRTVARASSSAVAGEVGAARPPAQACGEPSSKRRHRTANQVQARRAASGRASSSWTPATQPRRGVWQRAYGTRTRAPVDAVLAELCRLR